MSNELEAFLEYISITRALSKKSVEAYKSDLVGLEEEANKSLIALDSSSLLSLLSKYENKRTLNRKLSSVNAFFNFCHKEDFHAKYEKLKFAKIPKSLPKFLSYEEVKAGLSLIDRSTWLGQRDYALILFLYARTSAFVEIGGTRFGIITAPANVLLLSGATSFSIFSSRR